MIVGLFFFNPSSSFHRSSSWALMFFPLPYISRLLCQRRTTSREMSSLLSLISINKWWSRDDQLDSTLTFPSRLSLSLPLSFSQIAPSLIFCSCSFYICLSVCDCLVYLPHVVLICLSVCLSVSLSVRLIFPMYILPGNFRVVKSNFFSVNANTMSV